MNQETRRVHKRNRFSFVCTACRKRKSKCDKTKPICNKCLEQGTKCVYDFEQQPTPKNPTKSSETIAFLQKELEYWKAKAQGTGEQVTRSEMDQIVIKQATQTANINYPVTEDNDKIMINLSKSHNTIIIHKQIKYQHKPFSILAMLQRDPYLRTLYGSIYGATFTEMHQNLNASVLKAGSVPTTNKVEISKMLNCEQGAEEKPIKLFLDKVIHKSIQKRRAITNTIDPTIFLSSNYILEESTESEHPKGLKSLISSIESVLPQKTATSFYLRNFYQHIYPLLPFLNIASFSNTLKDMLLQDKSCRGGSYYKVKVESHQLRTQVENLAILLSILSISYTSLSLRQDTKLTEAASRLGIFDKNKVPEKTIELVKEILCFLNISRFTNENTLCCLLYLKASLSLRPENDDIALVQESVITLSSLTEMAVIIGLYKDPTQYAQLTDPCRGDSGLQNYRRKLWFSVVSMNMTELLPNGGCCSINQEYLECFLQRKDQSMSYTASVVQSMDPKNLFDLQIHDMLLKEYKLLTVLNELNSSCTSVLSSSPLLKIEKLILKVQETLEFTFPFSKLTENSGESHKVNIGCLDENIGIDFTKVINSRTFVNNLLTRSILLNVTGSLAIYFETLHKEFPFKYTPYFEKFLLEAHKHCFEMIKLLEKYLGSELDEMIPSAFRYSTNMIVQTTLSRIMLFLCSSILRFTHAERKLEDIEKSKFFLYNRTSCSDFSESTIKLDLIGRANQNCCNSLRLLVELSSKNLSPKYSACTKVNCIFEYILHIIHIGKLLEVSNRFWDYKLNGRDIPKSVSNNVFFKWGLDVNDAKAIKEELDDINLLGSLNVHTFENMTGMMDSFDLGANISFYDSGSSKSSDISKSNSPPLHLGHNHNSSSTREALLSSIDPEILDYFTLFDLEDLSTLPQ